MWHLDMVKTGIITIGRLVDLNQEHLKESMLWMDQNTTCLAFHNYVKKI